MRPAASRRDLKTPARPAPPWQRDAPWLLMVLLAAWALRVHALGAKSLWYDELRQVEVAQHALRDFTPLLIAHSGRPLDYVLTHFWLRGGAQEFWLRLPAAWWGMLSVAVMAPLARRWLRLAGRLAPLAATALLALAPLAVEYAQELRPYSLYLLLALLSAWLLERALAHPRPRRWLAFGAVTVAGTLTHFFYAAYLTAQALYVTGAALLGRPAWRARRWLPFGAAAAAGYLALAVAANPPVLAVLAAQFIRALVGAPAAGALVSPTGAAVRVDEALNAEFFLVGLLPHFGGGPAAPALLLFNGLAVAGLVALARQARGRVAAALLWLLAPALVIIYLQYRQQFFALRYILFALPLYLLLIAGGLAALARAVGERLHPRAGRLLAGLGLAALLLFQLGKVGRYYREPKDDWRRVGAFLEANTRPGDTLGAPDVQAFIRFYAPGQAATIVDANDLGPHEQALANGERFWFVWSEYTLRPVAETKNWAERLPGVTFRLDPRIKVIFVHPGRTQAEVLAEAERFFVPTPTASPSKPVRRLNRRS